MDTFTDMGTKCSAAELYSTAIMAIGNTSRRTEAKADHVPLLRGKDIGMALCHWFDQHKRNFKFRNTRDPYAIMISEFMLQQTTVAAVLPFYDRFLERFPGLSSLAEASEDDVMAMWAGLGYYRRARQLLAAAKMLVDEFSGEYPRTVAELEKLPGFGRYTAGAVLSAAYDIHAPILEANTIRVFARLGGIQGMIGDSAFMKRLWLISQRLVTDAPSARTFNFAAMELGAVVCRQKPACGVCPVQEYCMAYRMGIMEQTPQLRPRPAKVDRALICFVLYNDEGKFLMRRIPKGEWHAGMWEFPSKRIDSGPPSTDMANRLAEEYLEAMDAELTELIVLRYQVTHHAITCYVFHCHESLALRLPDSQNGEFAFVSLAGIADLALGSAQKKLFKLLEKLS